VFDEVVAVEHVLAAGRPVGSDYVVAAKAKQGRLAYVEDGVRLV
jgi:molybdopterin-guanine dinucleotide biosynthesis protein A